MIDIVASLIEQLLKVCEVFRKRGSMQRKHAFGRSLTSCYLRLLDVMLTAEQITKILEDIEKGYDVHGKSWLDFLVKEQVGNLSKLSTAVYGIAREVFVLDPELVFSILEFSWGKSSDLSILIRILWNSKYPLEVSYDRKKLTDYLSIGSEYKTFDLLMDALRPHIAEFPIDVKTRSISTHYGFSDEDREAVREYLSNVNPAARLATMMALLKSIRAIIIENFTLEEVLLELENL